jgi:hypothetical protein
VQRVAPIRALPDGLHILPDAVGKIHQFMQLPSISTSNLNATIECLAIEAEWVA